MVIRQHGEKLRNAEYDGTVFLRLRVEFMSKLGNKS